MSKWRQAGYVPDSDDEEEDLELSPIRESQHASSPAHIERASSTQRTPKHEGTLQNNRNETTSESQRSSPTPSFAPVGPAISTTVPTSTITLTPSPQHASASVRDRTESPDILQSCLNPVAPSRTQPSPDTTAIHVVTHDSRNVAIKQKKLADFGLDDDLFSSSDDNLSDPPPDVELEILERTVHVSPKRNAQVQIVIPSPAVVPHETQQYQTERPMRKRRPVQLHPYRVEDEMWRQELKKRGIDNVPRYRSPVRHLTHNDTDTQDLEFNPENGQDSMARSEPIVSSPMTPQRARDNHQTSARRRRSLTPTRDLALKAGTKIRRLNHKTSAVRPTGNVRHSISDVWSLPPSPPHANSSPAHPIIQDLMKPLTLSPEADLPTPSLSSSLRGDVQGENESEDDIVQPLRRPAKTRVVSITISSSESATDDSEAEPSETERIQVGRRLKGIFPASYVRVNKQNQNIAPSLSKEFPKDNRSPEKIGTQRGVAQKVIRRKDHMEGTPARKAQQHVHDVISDESSDNDAVQTPIHRSAVVRKDAQAASELAAMLDKRYADDDSDMEEDHLNLFTLGGSSRKRKKQTKVTDTFPRAKKPKTSRNGVKHTTLAARASGKTKHTTSYRSRRTPPPALSVLDFDISPSSRDHKAPDFLKVARRAARAKPDLAREHPTHKRIRLHTSRDTNDALETLEKWRNGAIRQKSTARPSKHHTNQRAPLVDTDANQHKLDDKVDIDDFPKSRPTRMNGTPHAPPPGSLNSGQLLFRLRPSPTQVKTKRQLIQKNSPLYRPGQLEDEETQFKHTDRRFAFVTGLQKVDQQYNLHHPTNQVLDNPLLARFLVDDGNPLPSPPSAHDSEKVLRPSANTIRRSRKFKARRIEAETKEYRQPSEPDVIEILSNDISTSVPQAQTKHSDEQNILQGLSPHGTRYTTTFDVSHLKAGTFFHTSTFIGSGELRRALLNKDGVSRDLGQAASYVTISHGATTIRCGPWDDDTFSRISGFFGDIWQFRDNHELDLQNVARLEANALQDTSKLLRMVINYVAVGLSFLDPVDRQLFSTKMKQTIESIFTHALSIDANTSVQMSPLTEVRFVRMVTYLLVLTIQVHRIAQHPDVLMNLKFSLAELAMSMLRLVISHVLRKIVQLGEFLEKNKRFAERENGIQDTDMLVESVVVCMQVDLDGMTFWDIVSQELRPQAEKAMHVKTFESLWATLFTLLPFVELDDSGTLNAHRRTCIKNDNWSPIALMLKQLFSLYPQTHRARSASLDDYIRVSLTRVHWLIQYWHWHRCDAVLKVIFDFFGKNNFRLLRREQGSKSKSFFENLPSRPSLGLVLNENSFKIFLKCLVLCLQGVRDVYSVTKFRSLVFRLTPNHCRVHPKDQALTTEDLNALQNNHDLLSTLYWASPPPCRPRLDLIRALVQHEHSHREACRINVRTWENLTAFQLSTEEPYTSVQPFAEWHNDMMTLALKQYRLAKVDAEEALKAGSFTDTNAASILVRQTIEKNQEQVLATVHDCIAGMKRAVEAGFGMATTGNEFANTTRRFLADSGIVNLLELPHLEDKRLLLVIRETLGVLRLFAKLMRQLPRPEVDQPTSDESQDYGDSLDLSDIAQFDPEPLGVKSNKPLEFIETALWRLLSNAFGAESTPDENLLMDCIDTWTVVSHCQVSRGDRTWSYFLDTFSKVSWQQLQATEQTQKFGPYFMAALVDCDPAAYVGHEVELMTLLFSCLADRESMLRFQHRLLQAIFRVNPTHPLMKNLPFSTVGDTGQLDVNAETLRARRLSLISSLLSNMCDDFHSKIHDDPHEKNRLKAEYREMLGAFMTAMKNNYLQLGPRSATSGVYVEFVQRNVQFLKQYAVDICPVHEFFTNSVTFPTPSTDPTYVVGRLCSYAPKINRPGVVKELCMFIQTVAQQAAAQSQQSHLAHQLEIAFGSDEPTKDRTALRDVLMQGIFPAYVEMAFTSVTGFAIAKPILVSLRGIVKAMIFGMRVLDDSSSQAACESIMSIVDAFMRSADMCKGNLQSFRQAHVLAATRLMVESMMAVVPVLQYMCSRWFGSTAKPAAVKYMEELNVTIVSTLHDVTSPAMLSYKGIMGSLQPMHVGLLTFSRKELRTTLQENWSVKMDSMICFGHGHGQREVPVDVSSPEEEKAELMRRVGELQTVIGNEYDEVGHDGDWVHETGRSLLGHVDV